MIVFNRLWKTMKEQGISSYALRENHIIESKTIRSLKANKNVTTATLNKLCTVLNCKLEDIAEYIPDKIGKL